MKKTYLFAALMLLCTLAFAQNEKIIAPAYPGSVKDAFGGGSGSATYYSKESAEKITLHYEGLFTKATDKNGAKGVKFIEVKDEDAELSAFDAKRGVNVHSRPRKSNYYVSQALAQLQSAYLEKFSGTSAQDKMKHVNDTELQNVIKKYEYLKNSFYLKTRSEGSYKGIEEILYDKFFANPEEIRERKMNDYMNQYTEKIAEGDMEAAAKISEKMNSLSQSSKETTDVWAMAIRYLDELEKLAFTTMISIDIQP